MAGTKYILLQKLREGGEMSKKEQFKLTLLLSLPAILAQLSMCLMTYIDAAMVGRLGSAPAAAVGLVSTTTWIFSSLCYANTSGFSVQIAHKCGARDYDGARAILKQGLLCVLGLSVVFLAIAVLVSKPLPVFLGGSDEILDDASAYFLIYSLFLPVFQIAVFAEGALIASGNLKVPSITSLAMCGLDVVFNYIFIFILGMGAKGAALGTGLAELLTGGFLLIYVFTTSPELRQKINWMQVIRRIPGTRSPRTYVIKREISDGESTLRQAFRISWPLWVQNIINRGASVVATMLVAPLGTIAIAANSFAIIAEGFCYLPAFGMQDAATTLVGQSLGAKRKDLARSFAYITTGSGACVMTMFAVMMWTFAPDILGLMSQDPAVISLGAQCLRIEAWAEFFFGISIVGLGCCIGAGDTKAPALINLLSMWVIRLGLSLILIPRFGLLGYWYAMAIELSVKGIIFALRLKGDKWMKTRLVKS